MHVRCENAWFKNMLQPQILFSGTSAVPWPYSTCALVEKMNLDCII